MVFGGSFHFLVVLGCLLWDFLVLGGSWLFRWFLVVLGCFWWFLVDLGGSWWLLAVLAVIIGSWCFLVGSWLFCLVFGGS